MVRDAGFVDFEVSKPFDTFGQSRGEKNARRLEVYGYTFEARKPG